MLNASKQEYVFTTNLCAREVFEEFTTRIMKNHSIGEPIEADPVLIGTRHGEGEESLMIYDLFSVIQTGNRHWLISEGRCAGDSPGCTLSNIVALPMKGLHEKEIKRAIKKLEHTSNAAEIVVFSYDFPGVLTLNTDGRYVKSEDEDVFHTKVSQQIVSTKDDHGNPLKDWQKMYTPSAVEFHERSFIKLLQRSYRRR